MKKESKLFCYGCGKEFGLGDSIRFIKFDHTTNMVGEDCYKKLLDFIELLHKRRNYNDI